MTLRIWGVWLVLVSLNIDTLPRANAAPDGANSRPNIVLILADDLGFETIGANGGASYKTPILDAMANRGIRFEHCYAQPICTPSRVKLLTGQCNIRNYVNFEVLHRSQRTFANVLQAAGYATCIVGKWQLGTQLDLPQHFGFDEHRLWQLHVRGPRDRYANPLIVTNGSPRKYDNGEYGPDIVAEYAADFIHRNREKPFLLFYPMMLTHAPFEPTPKSTDWRPTIPGKNEKFNPRGDKRHFEGMVEYMDGLVGRLLDTLEAEGVRENTIVIFTGDNGTDERIVSKLKNGAEVRGGKHLLTDAGTRVPLIVDWPAQSAKAALNSDLVDFSDFLPTLCEAAGVPVPAELVVDGRSFLPQIKGQAGQPRDWIYMWCKRNTTGRFASDPPGIFARTRQYKLYEDGRFYDVPADSLEKHPLEQSDLSPEQQQVKKELQEVIHRFGALRGSTLPPEVRAKFTSSTDSSAKSTSPPQVNSRNEGAPKKPRVPENVRLVPDLEYARAGDRPLRLDLYLPKQSENLLPVMVWVHGGGWRRGSKHDCPAVRLAEVGYAVASVEYRLSQEAKFPAQIEDCKSAIRWLRANADRYNLDRARFGAWGSSAGGHLVALLATADVPEWDRFGGNADFSSRVQAACDWYGPTDFLLVHQLAGEKKPSATSAVRQLLGGDIEELPEKAVAASPISHVTGDDPPMLIMHGDRDEVVPLEHSRRFSKALNDAGADATLMVIEGGGHGLREVSGRERFGPVQEFFDSRLRSVPASEIDEQVK